MSLTIDPQPTKTDIYQDAVKVATAYPDGSFVPVQKRVVCSLSAGALNAAVPEWATKVKVMFRNLTFTGTDGLLLRIADNGTVLGTGMYNSTVGGGTTGFSTATSGGGFVLGTYSPALQLNGVVELTKDDTVWYSSGVLYKNDTSILMSSGVCGPVSKITGIQLGYTITGGTASIVYS